MRCFIILPMIFALFIASCSDDTVYEKAYDLENHTWKANDVKQFKVKVDDTTSLYNFIVNIRTTRDYEYSNLYVFLRSINPDSTYRSDTIEFILADHTGKWTGNTAGGVIENNILVYKNLRFSQNGKYLFEIEQAMRNKTLNEVVDVGISIKKAE